jgi:hypothetical protein
VRPPHHLTLTKEEGLHRLHGDAHIVVYRLHLLLSALSPRVCHCNVCIL